LWKLLIDGELKRKDLKKMTGLSSSSMAKLGKNDQVSLDILMRICDVLNCQIGDIMEFIKNGAN
jgi:DNA-binding Xre family transcriptional regulator